MQISLKKYVPKTIVVTGARLSVITILFFGGILTASAQVTDFSITGDSIQALELSIPSVYVNETANYVVFQDGISLGNSNTSDFDPVNPQIQNLVTDWFAVNDNSLSIHLLIFDTPASSTVNDLDVCSQGNILSDCLTGSGYIDHVQWIAPITPTTTSTTTIEVDTRPLTYGFFSMLWIGTYLLTTFGISKFT